MNPSMHFAPLSGGPSSRLRFVVWYFRASAVLMLAFILVGLAHAAIDPGSGNRAALAANPFLPLLAVAVCGLMLVIAWLLDRQRREGAILAALVFLRSVVGAGVGWQVNTLDLVTSIVGLVLVATIWGELQPWARRDGTPTSRGDAPCDTSTAS